MIGSAEPMAEGSTRTVAVMPLESILEFEDAPKNLSREVQTAAPTDGSLCKSNCYDIFHVLYMVRSNIIILKQDTHCSILYVEYKPNE